MKGRINRHIKTARGPHGDGFWIVAGVVLAMALLAALG